MEFDGRRLVSAKDVERVGIGRKKGHGRSVGELFGRNRP